MGIELFVLPIDFFTFRLHEALVVRKFHGLLPGKFYPRMDLVKEEEGDLGHHTPYSSKRTVRWITDSYGYRKQESHRPEYDVVIIGQSETFGASLTQEEMLSEVLEKQLNRRVYPFAPAGVNTFLKEHRFRRNPPKIVIVSSMERAIFELPPLKGSSIKGARRYEEFRERLRRLREIRWVQRIGIFLDRLYKMNMVRYCRASLKRRIGDQDQTRLKWVETAYGTILFFEGATANREVPEEKLNQAVRTLEAYHNFFRSRGIRFIFLPIPNKETILYESLGTSRPVFLKQLVARLQQLGIETVDTQEAFEQAFRKGLFLYQKDDTHWNAQGVKVAAELIRNLIEIREVPLPVS